MLEDLVCAANKVVGIKQVTKEAQNGRLLRIYAAMDADLEIRRQIDELAEDFRIELVHISTRKELGGACGIKVPAACAGLLKEEEGQ